MTTANKITILRILLIPVFVLCAIYYGEGIRTGAPDERWRWAAIAVFVIASATDGLDGFIARRFNQKSHLGVILDPIADKGLLVAALITLSVTHWPGGFPIWFPVLVIGRDLIVATGAFLVSHQVGRVDIRPHWTGKVATFLTMVAIAWVMLQIPWPRSFIPPLIAGVFVFISGVLYFRAGLRQIHEAGHGGADHEENPPPVNPSTAPQNPDHE